MFFINLLYISLLHCILHFFKIKKGGDRFSGEAVRMLLTELENNRGNVLVIMAGYADKMQNLMQSDPGMPRRFAKTINLPDYNCDHLSEIAERFANKIDLFFDKGLKKRLSNFMYATCRDQISQHNGGESYSNLHIYISYMLINNGWYNFI